jgi:hypothetical protein
LGEEWADNDNAGTAAEAQAFKRACSCFGLGRYLYDLEGQWVDLDEKKRPLETPRLPDWARPKSRENGNGHAPIPTPNGSRPAKVNGKGSGQGRRTGGIFRQELLAQITSLGEAVGFSLTKSVLKGVANVEDAAKIRDMAKLTAAFEKLQDIGRGVERLRRAIEKCGAPRYSVLCQELNLASDSLDDIPDRATLRRILDILEAEAPKGSENPAVPATALATELSDLRGRVLREAARVSGATKRTLGDVLHQATDGTVTLAALKSIGAEQKPLLHAALKKLEEMATT